MKSECDGCSNLIISCLKYNRSVNELPDQLFCNDSSLQSKEEIMEIVGTMKDMYDAYVYETDMLIDTLYKKLQGEM